MSSTTFTMHFDPEPDVVAAARACEQDVFLYTYGNTAEEWEEEYGPYEPASVFLAITEPGGDAVAASRVIMPSGVGLKTLVDTSRSPWLVDGNRAARAAGLKIDQTMDIATIAVRKGVRNGALLSAAMYHGLTMATRANGMRWVIMIMDIRARRLLSMMSLETHMLPGTKPGYYLGSDSSVPVWAEVARMMDTQRRVNPEGFRLVSLGVGLDDITLPAPNGYTVKHRSEPGTNVEPVEPLPRIYDRT
jgi:hypothetical protein